MLDAICRKIGEVIDKTGGTEVLLAACFKVHCVKQSKKHTQQKDS